MMLYKSTSNTESLTFALM